MLNFRGAPFQAARNSLLTKLAPQRRRHPTSASVSRSERLMWTSRFLGSIEEIQGILRPAKNDPHLYLTSATSLSPEHPQHAIADIALRP